MGSVSNEFVLVRFMLVFRLFVRSLCECEEGLSDWGVCELGLEGAMDGYGLQPLE